MSGNIYHATATLAELSMAMSIGAMARIVQPGFIDQLSIETWSLRIQSEAGEFISVCFKWLCRSLNAWKRWVSRIPVLALFLQMGVLIIMAYGSEIYADGLFGVALFTAIIMIFWVVLNRSANSQESSPPMVEPSA